MEPIDGVYVYGAKLVKSKNSDKIVLILRNAEKEFIMREVYDEALKDVKHFFEAEIQISLPFSINSRGFTALHPLDPHFEIVIPQMEFVKI